MIFFGVSSPVARWVPIPLRLIVGYCPRSMGTPSFLKDRIHCRDSTGAGSPSDAVELCRGLAVILGALWRLAARSSDRQAAM
jgi:hypothetical protein